MKKVIALLLAMVLILGCAACQNEAPKKRKKKIVYLPSDASSEDIVSEEEQSVSDEEQDTDAFSNYSDFDWDEDDEEWDEEEGGAAITSKVTAASIGSDYYYLKPEVMHPGVVGLDARYKMVAKSKGNKILDASRMKFKCDDASVKFDKDTVIVPYSRRSAEKPLTVTVYDSKNPNRTGSYTFHFRKFSKQPTMEDNFDYYRPDLWYYEGAYYGNSYGEYENGVMNFTVEKEGDGGFEQNSAGNFEQAFGCFSARIKLPDKGLCNAAFWMCSDFIDPADGNSGRVEGLYNPKAPGQSGIEMDVFEYTSAYGAFNLSTYHWFGWNNYHQKIAESQMHLPSHAPLYDDYHIYSLVWTEHTYYTYMDEHLCFYYDGEGVGYGEVMVLLQLIPYYEDCWLGEYHAEFPFTMSWDWVRVWSLDDLDWSKTNKPKG